MASGGLKFAQKSGASVGYSDMNIIDWPHDKIRSAALRYITKHTMKESEWRFTCLDGLPERLVRIVQLDANERPIVTCFVDAQRWYAMTTARVFGVFRGLGLVVDRST